MKTELNKFIKRTFFLFIILPLISCDSCPEILFKTDWFVSHLVFKNKEILNNDLSKNGFDVPFAKSGIIIFSKKKNQAIFSYKRNILLKANFKENCQDNNNYLIMESNDSILNGKFKITIEENKKIVDGINCIEYRAILKSENSSIYMKKIFY